MKLVVIRQIRYEGEEAWVRKTIERSLSLGTVFDIGPGNTIEVTSHTELPSSSLREDRIHNSLEETRG